MTSNDPRFELVRRCLDGEATQDEVSHLESELKSDPDFRRAYLSYINVEQSLTSGINQDFEPLNAPAQGNTSRDQHSFRKGPLTPPLSAAAGLVIGFFFASITWAVVGVRSDSNLPRFERTLFEESFESQQETWASDFPNRSGEWGGDSGKILLNPSHPAPEHGNGIAKIEPSSQGPLSYLTRIVEIDELPPVDPGEMRQLEVFASFHGESPGLPERYTLRVATFSEAPGEIRSLWSGPFWHEMRDRTLTLEKAGLSTPGDEHGWQTLSAVIDIPDETRCVVISLAAGRLDASAPKTPHYFDDIQANLVIRPQPTRTRRNRR